MSMLGKVALVTGAAQGLGRGFAEVLLKLGAKVCVTDINRSAGEATVSAFQKQFSPNHSMFKKCDVVEEQDIKATFAAIKDEFGRIDIVVNNAGIAVEKNWTTMVDINLKGVIHGTMYGIEAMRKDNGGHGGMIVNISSGAGLIPQPLMPVYCCTKYGVVGFTTSWALNPVVETQGLRFMCLCPTFAMTAILEDAPGKTLDSDEIQKLIEGVGIMPVSDVTKAFEQLITMPDNNNRVMLVSKANGAKIVEPGMDFNVVL